MTDLISSNYVTFRNIDPITGTDKAISRTVPVHSFSEDLAWRHNAHDFRFGGTSRLISNQSVDYAKPFSSATTNASVIKGSGNDLLPASIGLAKSDTTSYAYGMATGRGIATSSTP